MRINELIIKSKEVWQQFRPAILFVLTFIVIYGCGTLVYSAYLESLDYETDVFTAATAGQSKSLLEFFGHNARLLFVPETNSVTIFLDDKPAVQVIEGCNGFAVLLLFISFLFAFRGRIKHYLWFIPVAVPSLWAVNILRVYWLALVVSESGREAFAWQKSVFTTSVFLVILLLWMFWIKLVSTKKAG